MLTTTDLMGPFSSESLPGSRRLAVRSAVLIGAMALAVLTVALIAHEDALRESSASLADFIQEQETLARSVALLVEARVAAAPASSAGDLLARVRPLERAGSLRMLLRAPGSTALVGTDGRRVESAPLLHALRARTSSVQLEREEAERFALPRRRAIAGLATVQVGGAAEPWGVAAVATAWRERDRERHAAWRALLTVAIAAGLVLAFGGVALGMLRRELRAQRALEIEDLRRRRDEQLERQSRAATLGTLAMGITHELSTPLGIIGARAEQLLDRVRRQGGDERARHGLRVIQEQVERMGEVIRGFLGLARGGSPAAQNLRPEGLIAGAVGLVEHKIAETGIALRIVVPPDLPQVRGDARLLEHALVNLLLNARDACRHGGHLELRAERQGEYVALTVTDDGIGISRADAERALEPFFTTKPAGQGAGLGLAVAHEIVKSHRGLLQISPRPERGTSAVILLPTAATDGDTDEGAANETRAAQETVHADR